VLRFVFIFVFEKIPVASENPGWISSYNHSTAGAQACHRTHLISLLDYGFNFNPLFAGCARRAA
jgi:hypothetical protein